MDTQNETANVLVEIDGPIAYTTLNRPEKRNALSRETMSELRDAVRSIGADPQVRVVVIGARGTVFCAGHDLSEMVGRPREEYESLFGLCVDLMEAIQAIPQPVIAMVQGPATAAGCQLVATCDLAVASDNAWFATPGVKIGLFCSTPMVAVSRAVGRKLAMEMLLTGEPISAQAAKSAGLINRVVPAAELERATRELAEKVIENSATVTAIGKQAFYEQVELSQHEAYGYTAAVMTRNAGLDDAREGITAFLEKRRPRWK